MLTNRAGRMEVRPELRSASYSRWGSYRIVQPCAALSLPWLSSQHCRRWRSVRSAGLSWSHQRRCPQCKYRSCCWSQFTQGSRPLGTWSENLLLAVEVLHGFLLEGAIRTWGRHREVLQQHLLKPVGFGVQVGL